MQTISISTTYRLKWQFKKCSHYKMSDCRTLINCRTGKVIKQVLNGSTKGYWIESRFYSIHKIKKESLFQLIPEKENCPF